MIGLFCRISLFYRAVLHKRPIILRSLLIVATPYLIELYNLCHYFTLDLVCTMYIIYVYVSYFIFDVLIDIQIYADMVSNTTYMIRVYRTLKRFNRACKSSAGPMCAKMCTVYIYIILHI